MAQTPWPRTYNGSKVPKHPGKTIWGRVQKRWLKDTLLASDATFKILISPTPMVGTDGAKKRDNHTNIGGFLTVTVSPGKEGAKALFEFYDENGRLLYSAQKGK